MGVPTDANKDKGMTATLGVIVAGSLLNKSPGEGTNQRQRLDPAEADKTSIKTKTGTGTDPGQDERNQPTPSMHSRDALTLDLSLSLPSPPPSPSTTTHTHTATATDSLPKPVEVVVETVEGSRPPLQWDWNLEHEDRKLERKADAALHGATPFEVDRKLLKDVVREKMGREVGRIRFLSAGTFHKAYLVTLTDHYELVARVARRFMPRLKTESEVATIHYLREKTKVPVPTIYHYDSNPYNRLGGEFILMSKAPGIPLSQVFHTLPYNTLVVLLKNMAKILISLFSHRFSSIGSLYFGPNPRLVSSGAPTPKAAQMHYSAFPFSPRLDLGVSAVIAAREKRERDAKEKEDGVLDGASGIVRKKQEYHVGPIISWPFFGSNRGELSHPTELNRGPWNTTHSYLTSCVSREINGVISENEGRSAPHKLHLDPAEIVASRHHRVRAVPGDESDASDEWDLEESEEEWEGPGDRMYRDYRRMQRSTFLVAHLSKREEKVRREMGRWMRMMEHLGGVVEGGKGDAGLSPGVGGGAQGLLGALGGQGKEEEFGLDCHDLSLENVFVDAVDHTKITCIIDWESTTTRPLWQCAHVPAFLQSSPFVTKVFLEAVAQLPNEAESVDLPPGKDASHVAHLCREWLYYESAGTRLRYAHRCAEWDGWEEGLVDSILGSEEHEDEWFRPPTSSSNSFLLSPPPVEKKGKKVKLPFVEERKREQMLSVSGDICGGRGGELGRRLEAWLSVGGGEEEARRGEGRFGHFEIPAASEEGKVKVT